jgi:hypothetical protein
MCYFFKSILQCIKQFDLQDRQPQPDMYNLISYQTSSCFLKRPHNNFKLSSDRIFVNIILSFWTSTKLFVFVTSLCPCVFLFPDRTGTIRARKKPYLIMVGIFASHHSNIPPFPLPWCSGDLPLRTTIPTSLPFSFFNVYIFYEKDGPFRS